MASTDPVELERATTYVRQLVDTLPLDELVRELRDSAEFADPLMAEAVVAVARKVSPADGRKGHWIALVGVRRAAACGALSIEARGRLTAGEGMNFVRRFGLALRHLDRARGAFRSLGDKTSESRVETRRSHSLVHINRNDDARDAVDRALHLARDLGDARLMGQAHQAGGVVASRLDLYRAALRCYRQASECYGLTSSHPVTIAPLLSNMARCLEAIHRFRAAQRYFERARARFSEHGYEQLAAQVDYNTGYYAFLRGNYARALSLYARAEAVFRQVDDQSHIAQINLDRTELYLHAGMPERSRALVQQILPALRRAGLKKERAQALFFLALADLLQGAHAEADRELIRARSAFKDLEYDAWIAECDQLRGRAAFHLGYVPRSRRLVAAAEAAFTALGLTARVISAVLLAAQIDLAEGEPQVAIERIASLDERLRRLGAPWLELEADRVTGLALLDLGDLQAGLERLEAAVAILESRRGNVPADEFMVAFLASRSAVYGEIVDAFVAAGRVAEAFEYCERGKSRALVDMLSGRESGALRRRTDHPGTGGLQAVRLTRLKDQLNALYARLHALGGLDDAPEPEVRQQLVEQLHRREEEFQALQLSAREQDPELGALTAVSAPELSEVQAGLDADTTLLEYFLTPSGGHVFVVTRDSIEHRHLALGDDQLERCMQRFRFHLSRFLQGGDNSQKWLDLQLAATRGNLERLTRALIEPLIDRLRTRRLLVVPHGALHGVPFHALPMGDGWLCDRFDIAYVPSAAVYAHCTRERPLASGPPCVIAVPDSLAPQIASEARAVATALGPETVSVEGDAATPERLREAAATSRVLHIASHALFRADHPMLSGIRLGAGAWLNLYDVYDLEVSAELVVLSACETGVARVTQGDEVLGLLRGFIYAGAPRLLISQWRVSDTATALFMQSFYRGCRDGHTYGESLRTAMGTVRADYPHPFHWAAFYMVGDSEARGRGLAAI